MTSNPCIHPGDNPDITKERQTASIDVYSLACELYGAECLERRRAISRAVAADPSFAEPTPRDFLAREAKIENAARKARAFIEKIATLPDPTDQHLVTHFANEVFGYEGFPLLLQLVMFLPALRAQADDELAREFIPRAERFEILGTYAQTEMGHGTNLRALETTATYDKATKEFVLNTPTTRAAKWWPGNLGKFANYAIIAAQLSIDGRHYGIHNFLLQLRDEKTHLPLKGISIGDIGPKLSVNVVDNGFLVMDHVRIPRKQMLMKHSKVSPDGVYTPPMHIKMAYITLVHVRAFMTFDHGYYLGVASTIATRYSAVRRQGYIEDKKNEVQILDYQTQQHRIFPQIARAYAFMFAGQELKALYYRALKEISNGKADLLPDLHAISSGLKAVVTFEVGKGVEQCRMACGGHGYSMASGFPTLYGIQIAACTYEGENMVMLQQLAKYLVKAVASTQAGKSLSPIVSYLGKADESRCNIGQEGGDEIQALLSSIEHAARRSVFDAAVIYQRAIGRGLTEERAWNTCTVEMNRAARLHTRLFIARAFVTRGGAVQNKHNKSALGDLLSLFLHYECVDMAQHLLEDGFCSGGQIRFLKERLYADLAKIRPNAVALVDAFDISERELNSVLGRRDGNVYDALYDWAKGSELNYTHVLPAVEKYIKPLQREQAKL